MTFMFLKVCKQRKQEYATEVMCNLAKPKVFTMAPLGENVC